MTKLKWLFLFLLVCSPAWAQYLVQNITVKQNGVANLQTKRNAFVYFNITLTNNATTSFIDVGVAGAKLDFNICQDPTGGWTWVWPPNFTGTSTISISPTAATCTAASFLTTDGLTWANAAASGATGAVVGAAGLPVQTQVNNGGGPPNVFGGAGCQTFANKDTGPQNNDCDTHFKGPNPYTDVTRYGVRITAQGMPASASMTGSISGGSNALTVSTSLCPAQTGNICFINGDGIVVYGAGTASGLSTPSAPTVTPSLALTGTRTGFVADGPTGATTYNYQIIARTKNGGYTAASSVGSTTTGAAALGAQSVSATSCTRSNDVVTCTTASSHGFNVGCSISNVGLNNNACGEVYTSGFPDVSFNGWWQVTSAADATHFTWTSAIDTRNNATTSSSGSGTVQWWNCNHVMWTAVTGAWIYYIYGRTGGSLTLIGVSMPQGAPNTDLTWDDFGSPMMDNFTFPTWIPTTPPVSGAANNFVTTIASGAGTTTLTLATNATTTVSGGQVRFDNTPNILTAATIAANSTGGQLGANGGALFFPLDTSSAGIATNNGYYTNSYLNLTTITGGSVTIAQAGPIVAEETWEFQQAQQFYGDRPFPTRGTVGSFFFEGRPQFAVNGIPGIYISQVAALLVKGVQIQSLASNGALTFFGEGQFNFTFDDCVLGTGTSGNDYMGIALYLRGNPGGQSAAFGQLNRVLLSGGVPAANGSTHTPMWFCNDCGVIIARNLFVLHRGVQYKGDPSGGSELQFDFLYQQGGVEPGITASHGATISVSNWTLDTVPNALIAGYTGSGSGAGRPNSYNISNIAAPAGAMVWQGAGFAYISGLRVPTFGAIGFANNGGTSISGQPGIIPMATRDASALARGTTQDGIFGNDTTAINANDISVAVGPSNSFFVMNAASAAPTCSVSAGGGVAVGTYFAKIAPVWWNGSEGIHSQASASCTTTPGNQTLVLSWSAIPGNPKGYDVYVNGITASCIPGPGTPVTTGLTLTVTTLCGQSGPNLPGGGPSIMMPGVQGIAAPAMILSGSGTITAPAGISGFVPTTSYQNSVYDNFNRAGPGLGSNWTTMTGTTAPTITSNAVLSNTTTHQAAIWNATTFANDQFSEITLGVSGQFSSNMVVRGTASGNGYACVMTGGGSSGIFKITAGVLSSLVQPGGGTNTIGDVLRCEVAGTTITFKQNGAVFTSVSDSSYASGSPGIGLNFTTSAILDNWSGGNLHPLAQLDTEQDWTPPQHFLAPVTIGPTNPVAGALAANTLYAPLINANVIKTGNAAPTCSSTGLGGGSCGNFATGSDDISGNFTMTAGAAAGATGTVTLTFNVASTGNAFCSLYLSNQTAAWQSTATIFPIFGTTVNTAVWTNAATNLVNTNQYAIGYFCSRH